MQNASPIIGLCLLRLEELLAANTELTEQVRQLTREIHERIDAPREKG